VVKNNSDLSILLEKFKNGDQHAFEEIYKQCYGHIAFVCSKLCHNKEDVEEIVQDTFMVAFKKADELRGDTLLALLRKIAVRRCYKEYKKNQIKRTVYLDEEIEEVDAMELDEDFLPEEYLQSKELQTELLQIVNDLPPKQREMIYLYYYVDINTEEIARLNNCPSVNVRRALHAARNTIKSKIGLQRMAGVSLASVLLAEEQAFAAGYVIAGAAAGTTVVTKTIIGIAASVMAVGVISAAIYFALLPNAEVHEPPEPTVVISTPIEEPIVLIQEEPKEELEETPEKTPEEAVEEEVLEIPEALEEPVYTPIIQPPPQEEPPLEEEPLEEEPEEPYEPEPLPMPIDRTPQILAALAEAAEAEDVNRIIEYYGFSLATQVVDSVGDMFRFYVLDEGSGDILIGVAAYEDGGGWRMKFEHFSSGHGQRPLGMFELFDWMEG